jgi:hypothetical protein
MSETYSSRFFVSRQQYWGEENPYTVEIACGGLNYANPDMLGVRWANLGEGKEFSDPEEAVEAAIAICEQWRKTQPEAQVAMGHTGGNTLPFEGEEFDSLRLRAKKLKDELPKCDQCGGLLGKDTYTHELAFDGEKFCREYCAEKHYNEILSSESEES